MISDRKSLHLFLPNPYPISPWLQYVVSTILIYEYFPGEILK